MEQSACGPSSSTWGYDDNEFHSYASYQLGHLLSTSADVVERILKCLNYGELNRCANVCALWNSTAKRLKSKRCFVHAFRAVHRMKQVRVWRHMHHDPILYDVSEGAQAFLNDLMSAWCEPAFGIFFATQHISDYPGLYFPKSECFKRCCNPRASKAFSSYGEPCTKCIVEALPKSCVMLHATVAGVIGTCSTPFGWGIPLELQKKQGLCGIFFSGTMPGVSFHPFYMPNDYTILWPPYDPDFGTVIDGTGHLGSGKKVEDIEDLKCVLMFTACEAAQLMYGETVLDAALAKYDAQFALGGAITALVDAPMLYGDSALDAYCVGLCVSGKNVRAASIVLSEKVKGPQAVEAELRRLKEGSGCSSWRGKMVGFMLSCMGRGTSFHRKRNLEAKTFAKVFPNTPLLGLFGNGEFGLEYLPAARRKGARKSDSPLTVDSCLYEYTTVFVLLSFGEK